jgi:hypothetical protein
MNFRQSFYGFNFKKNFSINDNIGNIITNDFIMIIDRYRLFDLYAKPKRLKLNDERIVE